MLKNRRYTGASEVTELIRKETNRPRFAEIPDILKNPDLFHSKRVIVSGHPSYEFGDISYPDSEGGNAIQGRLFLSGFDESTVSISLRFPNENFESQRRTDLLKIDGKGKLYVVGIVHVYPSKEATIVVEDFKHTS